MVVFLTVMVDLIGFGIIVPILPLYAENFGASGLKIGMLMGIFSLMQLIFLPLWGRLSDRIGRRPVFLISIAGNALSLLLCAFAGDYWTLFMARLIAGICSSNISVANAYVADCTPPEDRARGMGKIGAARGIGFVLGPAFGGALAQFGQAAPFLGAAALAFVNLISAACFLKESLSDDSRNRSQVKSRAQGIRLVNSIEGLKPLVVMGVVQIIAFSMLEMSFVLFTERRLELSPEEAGTVASAFFVYLGVVIAVVQGGLIGRLTAAWGERNLVMVGLALVSVGMFLITLTPTGNFMALLLFVAVVAAGQSLVTPSLSSLLSRATPVEHQGAVFGLYQSGMALARTIGPLTAGVLFDRSENMPYWVGGSLMVVALLGALATLRRPLKQVTVPV
jgi:multidrug resistance protein